MIHLPVRSRRAAPALAAAALAFAFTPTAALAQPGMPGQPKLFKAGSGPDELWDVTFRMEMPGMAMPAQTQQSCIKKGRSGSEDAIPRDSNCKVTDLKVSGNKTTYAIECSGRDSMSGRGEIIATPTAYDGKMWMKSKRRGQDVEMTQIFSGRKVGACTDQSEQVIASYQAKAQADADKEIAKVCTEGIDKLHTGMFFDKGQICESRQKAYCERVGTHHRTMQDPAGFKQVLAKYQAGVVKEAFSACRLDWAATVKPMCAKAGAAKDWQIVGSGECDDEVRANGPTYCKGRDYYLVDRSLTWLCNRYARLTRGAGATADAQGSPGSGSGSASRSSSSSSQASAPPPPPEAPKPDPVRQGVDALRRVLPF